jgi:hypothetical protein
LTEIAYTDVEQVYKVLMFRLQRGVRAMLEAVRAGKGRNEKRTHKCCYSSVHKS